MSSIEPVMEPEVESGAGVPGVASYDFRRPHRISKERLRTLEAMYDRLVKSLEGWLLGRVRGKVDLRLRGVEETSLGEFALSLPSPCTAYLFGIQDSGGQRGIVEIGHAFSYFLVDRLFGGGGSPKMLQRALTPIERMAVRVVAERSVVLLAEAWQDHVTLAMELTGFESIPDMLQTENRDDPMLVARIDVAVAGIASNLSICLPLSVLETFLSGGAQQRRTEVSTGSEKERQQNRELAEHSLRATAVPVAVRLPDFPLTMRELASLRPGSVISTGIPADTELQVLVSGRPRFRGMAGKAGRKLAVRILTTIDSAGETAQVPFHTKNG